MRIHLPVVAWLDLLNNDAAAHVFFLFGMIMRVGVLAAIRAGAAAGVYTAAHLSSSAGTRNTRTVWQGE
jgi:hypothetical protein